MAERPTISPSSQVIDAERGAVLHRAHLTGIDPRTVYLLAKLRQDVFSVEQKATDPDLDGRELEPGTTLLWVELPAGDDLPSGDDLPEPVAHIRVLTEADGMRIGRLAVRAENRRDGYGGQVMRAALDLTEEIAPEQVVRIDAQAYLEKWYLGMGYRTVGEEFMEAGIPHVPMEFRHPR